MIFIYLFYLISFITGTCFASFAALIGHRLPAKISIIKQPSRCDNCQRPLTISQLMPIWSYLRQKGTCVFCHRKIFKLYFILEWFGGLLGIFVAYLYLSANEKWLSIAILLFLCEILIVTDIEYYLVPDSLLMIGFITLFIVQLFNKPISYGYFLDAVFCFFLFFILNHFYPNKLGGGDVKFLILLSWFFGLEQTCRIIFAASLTALVYYFFRKSTLTPENQLPFIPFLVIGLWIQLIFSI